MYELHFTFFLDLSLSLSLWCFFFLSLLPPPPESTDPRRSSDDVSPVEGMEAIEGRPGGAAGADRPGQGRGRSARGEKEHTRSTGHVDYNIPNRCPPHPIPRSTFDEVEEGYGCSLACHVC